ncbi:bifunctional adenosylcobinamide kinase/adenosylcobinamide-phosphate guanylyltransferase [Kushneria phosphatilytica]|uniref:Bifunctional adenosylcobalamin biosynthesis protein n=1 Tax=Kushneria phosphatilytica TaxID=657387 RepID=A0A1S1NWQ4_9GAMM|nr:bifunctional adenosylcobinamide kinase/adenosylcobinamide-phosphate guanylyltransferase [Kushneria phosphatilytica]OHV11878.1 bifunctional adenosylcobinamide kinase/adenosylcobinamide-phosphate guanylyltransferase [Kushneria phosphatilytica]QEL11051.1 bifunctional adenosylcobinamide kinase/adenosylcobinamide-phosphate guanylyltransferase [Kushneria phosphatilytica]
MLELILGGARSGKSAFAEKLAMDHAGPVTYIATAQPLDAEMQARIESHRAQRPTHWQLQETPLGLARTLACIDQPDQLMLVDCLTLWVTNALLAEETGSTWASEYNELLALLDSPIAGRVLLVSNEVGQGITPIEALSRRFIDETGRLHQALATRADRVWWVVAGLPQCLKGETDA